MQSSALFSTRVGTSAWASTSVPAAVAKNRTVVRMPTTTSSIAAVVARPPLRKSSPRAIVSSIPRASPSDDQRASGSGSGSDAGSGSDVEGEESLAAREARLAALERGARRGGGARPRSLASAAAAQQQASKASASSSGPAEWPEGQLLPNGWEDMSVAQRAVELYQGRRGVLFWASQAAWYSVLGVGFGWVLFRFVLPGIGLYKLANGLTDAPTPL